MSDRPLIRDLVRGGILRARIGRWCNYGVVHGQNDTNSNVRVRILTNCARPDAQTCERGSLSTDHMPDAKLSLDLFRHHKHHHHETSIDALQ
eukprot:3309868-Pyramimonas_sp.AAC.1